MRRIRVRKVDGQWCVAHYLYGRPCLHWCADWSSAMAWAGFLVWAGLR